MKTTNTTTKIISIIAVLFCTNANAGDGMGMDSTNIVPNANIMMLLPNKNVAKASIKSGNESCAAYAGNYGIPAGATLGTVVISYENEPTKSNYGQIVYMNSSGCSMPSEPATATRQCSAYAGSYGIPAGAQGTFTITTEGNQYKSNYGAVLSVDTSGCYVPPPPPPPPPGCRLTNSSGGGVSTHIPMCKFQFPQK